MNPVDGWRGDPDGSDRCKCCGETNADTASKCGRCGVPLDCDECGARLDFRGDCQDPECEAYRPITKRIRCGHASMLGPDELRRADKIERIEG